MTFKELREASGMTCPRFAEYFEIPYRTVKGWDNGERECPEYLMKLMKYRLDHERGGRYIPAVHGQWYKEEAEDTIVCSVCGQAWNIIDNCTETFDHCPGCGAEMNRKER